MTVKDSAYAQLSKMTDGHDVAITVTIYLSTYVRLLDSSRHEYHADDWNELVNKGKEAIEKGQ